MSNNVNVSSFLMGIFLMYLENVAKTLALLLSFLTGFQNVSYIAKAVN